MKCAIIQQSTPTSNGTQDWTDPGINNDFAGAIFWGSDATANGSNTTQARLLFGATDGVRNIAFSAGMLDATAASSAPSTTIGSNTACLMRTASAGAETVTASVQSVLSTGVRLNFTNTDTFAYLFNGLLLSGSDISVKVSSVLFSTTDTSQVVTHNDTGTPQTIIALCSLGYGSPASDSSAFVMTPVIGIWDGVNSVGTTMSVTTNPTTPTSLSGRQVAGDMGHEPWLGTDGGSMSVSAVGPSTFTFNRTASNGVAMFVVFVTLRSKTGTWLSQVGQTTLPTTTGVVALVAGLPSPAQVLFTFPTRLISTAFVNNSDAAGSLGIGGACNNNGVTQQGASALTVQNNVATTVSRCYTSNALALLTLDNTGAPVNQASLGSWDIADITLNHTSVGASAFEMMYLTFGISYPSVVGNSYALASDEYF